MKFIDIDSVSNTFNSSSASLTLPDCSTITFAGLYWGGAISQTNTRYTERNRIRLMLPKSSYYRELTADVSWEGQHFKDITQLLNSSEGGNGTFTVANLVSDEGIKNIYAGWTIVVIYEQALLPLRNISVFDGFLNVGTNRKVDVDISGFSTPLSGPVNVDLGFVVYDGDRGRTEDQLSINNRNIFDVLHPVNNVFNSTISNLGSVQLDRLPSYNNTLGYDAAIIRLDNSDFRYVKNKESRASVNFSTNEDGYFVGVLTTSIDNYNPNIRLTHKCININNRNKQIGLKDTAQLFYQIKNIGNDNATRAVFTDTIPSSLDYQKGSIEVKYDSGEWIKLPDGTVDGHLYFDLGSIRPEGVISLRYKATVCKDVEKVRCGGSLITKYGWVQYLGTVNEKWSAKVHSVSSGVSENCSFKEPLSIPIDLPPLQADISINVYCSGTPVSDLHLPTGYSLYQSNDLGHQYPLDKLGEPGLYKAYRKLSTGCEYSFNVIARADSVTIYSQPDNIEATVGSGVAFSVGVKGENVSFQWQVNKGTGTWDDIPGATERSLTIPKVTEEMDGYNYRLRVTTPCKDYLLSVKVVLSVKRQPVSKPSEEPEPQPEVKDENVGALFVPNAFMPASNTQELRSFVVKGHGLAKWQMTIFNKWDQVIWKTDVIGADGSPAESWDGKMFGADAPQGAYMWAIEAVFEDGKEWEGMSVRDAKPRKSGVVYLLR